jgi:outer membrane protein
VKKSTLLLAAALFLVCAAGAQAQKDGLKIGFVDTQEILKGYPEAQQVQEFLEKKYQTWRDSLDMMSKAFQEQFEAYQSQSGTMTEAMKQQKQQELGKMQKDYQDFQQKKQSEGTALEEKMLAPVLKKVQKAIDDVAKDQKLSFIFDRTAKIQILLYGDPKFDYTNLVLDKLKRGGN